MFDSRLEDLPDSTERCERLFSLLRSLRTDILLRADADFAEVLRAVAVRLEAARAVVATLFFEVFVFDFFFVDFADLAEAPRALALRVFFLPTLFDPLVVLVDVFFDFDALEVEFFSVAMMNSP